MEKIFQYNLDHKSNITNLCNLVTLFEYLLNYIT